MEQVQLETEVLRLESERRALEMAENARRLAGAVVASPDKDFESFWFAVPVARSLVGEDGSLAAVAELASGTWYLAVERRGDALVAQTSDGLRGLLLDTTGIQRG